MMGFNIQIFKLIKIPKLFIIQHCLITKRGNFLSHVRNAITYYRF